MEKPNEASVGSDPRGDNAMLNRTWKHMMLGNGNTGMALSAVLLIVCYSSVFIFPYALMNSLIEPKVDPEPEVCPTNNTSSGYSKPDLDRNPAPNVTLMIDLHAHTKFSDGAMWSIDLIYYQNSTGRNATAITDHNTVDGSINGSKMAVIHNVTMPIIIGEEWGRCGHWPHLHIVMIFIDETLETDTLPGSAIAAVEECHEKGGVAIWAHPWRHYSRCQLEHYPDVLPYIDGIEWCPNNSSWVLTFALEYDLFVVYSSDIHQPGQRVERFSHIRVGDTSMESIKWSLRTGNTWLNVPNATNWVNITYPDGPGLYGRTWFGLPVGEKHQN